MPQENIDVLIIGAGPAGTVSAAYLAERGFRVKIIEKSKFPRYTIGESLIPRCMENFEEAGLLACLKKQGYQVKKGARFLKGQQSVTFDFAEKFGEGWDWTWQVPRDDFDQVLTHECLEKGVEIAFETTVTAVDFSAENFKKVTTGDKAGEQTLYQAKFVIDASGFGRVLARQLNLEAPPQIATHSSIFTQIKDIHRPQTSEGNLITFDILEQQVWFWYIPFSNGSTSIGFVGPSTWFKEFPKNPARAFREILQKTRKYHPQFKGLPYLFPPKKVENIAKNTTQMYGKGFALAGNCAEFLDPIFSSGIAFATESGLLAAKLIVKEQAGEKVNWETDYEKPLRAGTDVFSSYVKAWYNGKLQRILFHPNPPLQYKKQICAVLAGYVWDQGNPFVRQPEKMLNKLSAFTALAH